MDLHCDGHPIHPPAWVEVKNVTLVENGVALFPDAVSERGRKHLDLLARRVRAGERGAMIYVLQRADGRVIRPADAIDPDYGKALRRAAKAGVELHGLRVAGSADGLRVTGTVPVEVR